MHVHDSPEDHVIVMRSGRMRWTVEDQTLDTEPGDVIVTPAGTAHAYEVLGDSRRALSASTPTRSKPESWPAPTIVGLGTRSLAHRGVVIDGGHAKAM